MYLFFFINQYYATLHSVVLNLIIYGSFLIKRRQESIQFGSFCDSTEADCKSSRVESNPRWITPVLKHDIHADANFVLRQASWRKEL